MKPGIYETLERIAATINERKGGDPTKSYVAQLFAKGEDAMLKKIGEEATETVLAEMHRREGISGLDEKTARKK